MTSENNLPPGCLPNDIPGNRPGDTLLDRIWDGLSEADILDVHLSSAQKCEHARWRECSACGGRGHERVGPEEAGPGTLPCAACDGEGEVFDGCAVGVVLVAGFRGDGNAADCPFVAELVEARFVDARRGVAHRWLREAGFRPL